MHIRKYFSASFCILALMVTSCQHDALSDESVIDTHAQQTQTEQWIEQHFTTVYGPEVVYQWKKSNNQKGVYVYPPDTTNIKQVLNAVAHLCFDTFKDVRIEGRGSLLNYCLPVRITLYGGGNPDRHGFERMYNVGSQPVEMSIYHVNDFNANDEQKVFRLVRSVYHQMMKRMLEQLPYDRQQFAAISEGKYLGDTQLLSQITGANKDDGPVGYANKRGFLTYLSMLNAEDDMAEMLSVILASSPAQLKHAEDEARTPDYDVDPAVNKRYEQEAEQAYHDLMKKKQFVEDYVWKNWHTKLLTLQIRSVRTLNKYLNRK